MKVTAENAEGHSARAWNVTAEARTIEHWRNAAASATADLGGDADAVAVVRLGVSELLSNVAKHAENKTCRLTLQVDEKLVCVHVYDTSRQAPALTTPTWDAESGRGLWLLNSMVADWGYDCRPDGKAVWFRTPLNASEQEGGIADGTCFWCGTARRLVSVARYATVSGTSHTVYACTGCIASRRADPVGLSRGCRHVSPLPLTDHAVTTHRTPNARLTDRNPMSLEELVRPDLARQEAEDAARNLAHQAERLGLPLEDIEIIAPCPTCRRTEYSIRLGTLAPAQTRHIADALCALPQSASPLDGTC